MHITLWLDGDLPVRVPLANLHLFQSLLYKALPPERAAFLHDEGYRVDGRRMKLFAMSWPIADQTPLFEETHIVFSLPLRLVVSTPVGATLDGIASGVLSAEELRIGNNTVRCVRVEARQEEALSDSLTVRTLSPITCYEQVERSGKPYTLYFNPRQNDFSVSVGNNLIRKFRALYPERPRPKGVVKVTPLGEPRERIASFSQETSFPIKGWWGSFRLEGPRELLQVGLDCGLGAKNSAGWGCVTQEIQRDRVS